MNEKVISCIYEALDEANEDRLDQGLPALEKSPSTPIHGTESAFDSLGLINFVIAVEEGLERDFQAPVVLSDDRALSQEPSPFDSVQTLVDYVVVLLKTEHGVDGGDLGRV